MPAISDLRRAALHPRDVQPRRGQLGCRLPGVVERANPGDVERLLLDTAAQDGKRVRIGFGQDQAGKSQARHLVRVLSGFTANRPQKAATS